MIHEETGGLDYIKLEKLVRIISDLKNQDKDVVLVSSGAIGVGSKSLGLQKKPKTTSLRQACAAVGQGQLMMVYQRLFYEYHQIAAQVLLTFDVITSQERRHNAVNTFNELLQMDVIPVVNENDTVAIEEVDINFGDNDTLSAILSPTSFSAFSVWNASASASFLASMPSLRFLSCASYSAASFTALSISSSESDVPEVIVMCCSLPVPRSLADTFTIPFASISNDTSI